MFSKTSLLVLLFSVQVVFAGSGSIGGGGTAKNPTQITPQEKARLLQHQDPEVAFQEWLTTIDANREMLILKEVFDQKVVPQLK